VNNNVDPWLFSLQLHFEATRNTDPFSQAEVAATLLDDSALVWWIGVRRQRAEEQLQPPTWDEFQALIKVRYTPIEEIKIARSKLFQLRQNGSVAEYCARFQRLLNTLSSEFQEVTLVHMFVQGLRAEIQLQLQLRDT